MDAEQYCQFTGGHLVSINSYEELKMITYMCQTTTSNLCLLPIIFIGLSNNGSLHWLDRSPVALNFWRQLDSYPRFNPFILNVSTGEMGVRDIVDVNST